MPYDMCFLKADVRLSGQMSWKGRIADVRHNLMVVRQSAIWLHTVYRANSSERFATASGRVLVAIFAATVLALVATTVWLMISVLFPRAAVPVGPPLLSGVKATAGWDSKGCPRPQNSGIDTTREAVSAELTGRVLQAHPVGSYPAHLRTELVAQGFKEMAPCEGASSIRRASYSGKIIEKQLGWTNATVAWKIDSFGRIEWVKGFVFHTAL